MRQDRLVRGFERLDDFLVVLERVPDPLGGIGDVIEVDVEFVLQVALLGPLQVAQHRPLGSDDPPEVDDLLLRLRDVAHDLRRAAFEDVVLDAIELDSHLAEHRERGVNARVDDLVEQVAGSLRERRLAQVVLLAIALEHRGQRRQGDARQGDQVVRAHEQVELGGQQPTGRLLVGREVQDDEHVFGILVELGSVVARVDILIVEGVELEVRFQPIAIGGPG